MQAESEKQQSWKIRVRARSKGFHFKFKATTTLPTWKLHRLSIFLRLHNFLLLVKSHSQSTSLLTRQQQQKQLHRPTLKSRFLAALHKLRARAPARRVKNQNPETISSVNRRLKRLGYKVCTDLTLSSLVIGISSFVFRTDSEIDYKKIVALGSVILLYFAILVRAGKSTGVLAAFSVLATLVNCYKGCIAEFVLKAWNGASSSSYLKFS